MFKWKDVYSCNVREIDLQHEKLFELGSSLYELLASKQSLDHYDEIMELLSELESYTAYHFSYEEELMAQFEFEGLEEHKKEHADFIQAIQKFKMEDIDEKQSKVLMNMVMFVSD